MVQVAGSGLDPVDRRVLSVLAAQAKRNPYDMRTYKIVANSLMGAQTGDRKYAARQLGDIVRGNAFPADVTQAAKEWLAHNGSNA